MAIGKTKEQASPNYLLLFAPVLLLVVQSYFKEDLTSLLQSFGEGVVYSYWVVRAGLFALFAYFIYHDAPHALSSSVLEKVTSPYNDQRIVKDPLLGLRAFACICVFFGHWFYVFFGQPASAPTTLEYGARAFVAFSPWGGVWIFFALSGYLMAKGFVTGRHTPTKEGLLKFYRNRVLRIFPVYFIAVFLVAVLTKPEALDFSHYKPAAAFLDTLLFDQEDRGIIDALWSVSTEFQFYLLAPFIFVVLRDRFKTLPGLAWFALLFVAAIALIKFLMLEYRIGPWHGRAYFPFIGNLDCFMAGFATAFFVKERRDRGAYIKHGLTIGLGLLVLLYGVMALWSYSCMVDYPNVPRATPTLFLGFAPCMVAVWASILIYIFETAVPSQTPPNSFWKVQSFLGLLTYCIYVCHEPVLASVRKLFPQALSFSETIAWLPVGIGLTLAMAMIFYYFIETRFDKMRH